MPHIHTGPGQYDHTVSAFMVIEAHDEPQVLLHRHKKLGVYMQFGGHIELDETPWQAIIRELREESGYQVDQLQLLQPSLRIDVLSGVVTHPIPVSYNSHPIGSDHFHTDATYAFVTAESPRISPDKGESEVFKMFTARQLADLEASLIHQDVREIGQFVLDKLLDNWQRVPASEFAM